MRFPAKNAVFEGHIAGNRSRTPQSAHHPPKNHDEHRKCNPRDAVYFALLLGSDNPYTTPLNPSFSEKLKKAVAVSEEKIQERSRRRRQFSSSRFLARKYPNLAGMAFGAAGKSVKNYPAASRFAGKLFQRGISDSHSLLELSDFYH